MRSYQITGWGEPLELREQQTPEPQGEEVLVRVTACGLCHSDLHIWSGYFDLGEGNRSMLADRGVELPLTMGHEPIGVVEALGPDATGVSVGDERIVFPWIGCGDCSWCAAGDEHLCLTPRFIGARVDGGYGTHVVVPHARYLFDYAGIPRNLAATYGCSGVTAYSALKKVAPLGPDDHLLVVGAGGVGFNGIHLAPSVVGAKIVVADTDPAKRAAAHQAPGVVATIDNGAAGAVKELMKLTGGGAAAAIDFVGRPETFSFGIDCLAKSGTLAVVGLFGGAAKVPVPMFPFKSMKVCGSYVGNLQDMAELMEIVKAGKVPPIPIEERPIEQVNEALTDLEGGRVLGRIVLAHG